MFTGVIQKTARIKAVSEAKRIRRVRAELPRGWSLKNGASVSLDGICSTVVESGRGSFEVEFMPETLSKTTVGTFSKGRVVNLERSLELGDALDGHFVAGHVDAMVKITEVKRRGSETDLLISLPRHLVKYVASQGSITINGVSLTIAQMKGRNVTVALIPYTLKHTNLGSLKKGDAVNVEVDLLARYIAALLKR